MKKDDEAQRRVALSYVFIGFSVLFLVTALVLDSNTGLYKGQILPGNGGVVGPFTIKKPMTVIEVDVRQSIATNKVWSFITGELLDANKQYLTGFGDELYYEQGYDSDGKWVEEHQSYDNKLTIRRPGDYYLKFDVETNATSSLPSLSIRVNQKVASSIPHFIGGLLLLVIGVILNYTGGGPLRQLT